VVHLNHNIVLDQTGSSQAQLLVPKAQKEEEYSAQAPATRAPILTAAVIEKSVFVMLIFFGPVRRTVAMAALATIDGILAVLFVAYLAGL
jgi:hypothetical protein